MKKFENETKLKQILREKGLKQSFVANAIGMKEKTFNALVNGRNSIRLDTAVKIAEVINVSAEELA